MKILEPMRHLSGSKRMNAAWGTIGRSQNFSKLTNALIAPTFGSSYGLIKNRKFAKLPAAKLNSLTGYYHGEFSLNHPEEYADAVRSIIKG